jgi:hypothetical protein
MTETEISTKFEFHPDYFRPIPAISECIVITKCLEPCAFNLQFPHFVPIFNKISLLCKQQCLELERGFKGWKKGPKGGHFRDSFNVLVLYENGLWLKSLHKF